jgi:imidazolonepropionase-like amidohydrolase
MIMQGRTIIAGGLVITGDGAPAIENGVVVVENGRIAAVGPAGQFGGIEGEAEHVDARGGTVTPGLIDTHMHIFHETKMRRLSDSAAALWGARYVQSALRGGVTTIRDLGCQTDAVFGLREALARNWVTGPRLLACGRAICMTGGHGWANLSTEADGPDDIRRTARAQIKAGADVLKLMASGGAGTPGELPTQAQLSVEELRAGADEAHGAGKPVAVHALATQGILNAIEAGADSIEHGVFLDDTCIEAMLARNVALCPTISVYPRIVGRGPAGGEQDFVVQRSVKLLEPHLASLRRAVSAGVRIVFGTDSTTLYNPVGDIDEELGLMAKAGMAPLDIIHSATGRAAEACGIDQDVGTLRPAKAADILLVDGDARCDIAVMTHVRRVWRDGLVLYRADGNQPDASREALLATLH